MAFVQSVLREVKQSAHSMVLSVNKLTHEPEFLAGDRSESIGDHIDEFPADAGLTTVANYLTLAGRFAILPLAYVDIAPSSISFSHHFGLAPALLDSLQEVTRVDYVACLKASEASSLVVRKLSFVSVTLFVLFDTDRLLQTVNDDSFEERAIGLVNSLVLTRTLLVRKTCLERLKHHLEVHQVDVFTLAVNLLVGFEGHHVLDIGGETAASSLQSFGLGVLSGGDFAVGGAQLREQQFCLE